MTSKRIRKPPSRYVDNVESPFVNRTSRVIKPQVVLLPPTKLEDEVELKVKSQNGRTQVAKMPGERTNTPKTRNGRKGTAKFIKQSRKRTAANKTRRSKASIVESDDEREQPDFYSTSSDFDSEGCSSSSEEKVLDLPESSLEDRFCEEDEEMELQSEGSRDLSLSVASSSACEDIPVCPWIEIPSDRLPRLDLPSGSKDLLVDDSYLFDVLEIYETCRNYYRTIRLSPFLFEDFLAALMSEEQSLILAEIHIAFLKLALKNDEEEQVTLSVQDTNNSFNIIAHLIEPMTYAEVLRQYVESDPRRFPHEVLKAVDGNYPFVDVKRKITVLSWLCDRFLHSTDFRNIVRNEGKFASDEHCRECGKQGDVLLCDGCEACYHLNCANLTAIPEGQWLCQVCILHQVTGVTDCGQLSNRNHRLPFRMTPLGYDRHGRRYWFAVRRIIIQDDVGGSVYYYSTLPQLYALLSRFAVGDLEKHLAATIMSLLPKISEEMRKTQELTETSATLSVDRMADIFTQPLACTSFESDDERTTVYFEGKPVEISKTMLLTKVEELLGFKDGLFADLFWTAGLSAEKVLARRNNKDLDRAVASLAENVQPESPSFLGFRLGENGTFRNYQNQYSVNDYAKTPHMRAKERDRKKYLCNRFSLAEEGTFEWCVPKGQYLYGSESSIGSIIQYTLYKFAQRIPSVLMHRLWKRDGLVGFTKGTTASTVTVERLRGLLLRFECGIRKPVMASVFWGTLGHTRLIRLTVEDREIKQMVDAKKKKLDRELVVADADDEESDVVWVKYTKLGGPPKHNIWRLKDEQYRVNGRGGLSGWLWVSKSMRRDIRALPEKPPLGITSESHSSNLCSVAAKKAFRLAKLADKFLQWRLKDHTFELEKAQKTVLLKCYSPTCRKGVLPTSISDTGSMHLQACYSTLCRKELIECYNFLTSTAVSARSPCVKNSTKEVNGTCKSVMGEDIPFPLPVPFDFRVKRTGEQSLLVLPQKFLKRLARQGGLRSDFFAPGFHRIAKSNTHVWNYPCQRPLFDHCWRYLTLRARSYHAVALQLRILYACVRWADMERDEDEDERVTIHHPDHDEIRVVIGHKEFPPDGLYERYKLKVQLIPLEDPNDALEETGEDEEGYRPGRAIDVTRSSRKRRVVSKVRDVGHNGKRNTSKMKTVEKWIDGVELKLWEITAYWKSREVMRSVDFCEGDLFNQSHSILRSRLPRKRKPQPKRLPDYDYDMSDGEYQNNKQGRYDYRAPLYYAREGSAHSDSRESSHSESRASTQYASERIPQYGAQRARASRRLSSYGSGNSDLYSSDSPFNPRFRMRCRVVTPEDGSSLVMATREAGCLRGGGKGVTTEGVEQATTRVSPPSTSEEVGRSGSRSPIDEPPLIPRYDSNNFDEISGSQERIDIRSVPLQQRRVIYSSPSASGASLRPLASKVLMIRRADGTTQFLRPIAQSSSKDDRGQTRTVITTAQVGGSTMSEARGSMGLSNGTQRVLPSASVFTARQFSNRSLVDHAGLVQQRRVVPAVRGRYGQSQTRIVRIAPSNAQQASSSSVVFSPMPQLRVQSSSSGNGMIIAEKDPFVKRMTAEKAVSSPSVIYASSPASSIRRRPSGRDTYAGYYGEKSNDRIDVEEYQMLAEQGYRPPGRPPGRLASTFGYGSRVNQQRAILLSRGGNSGLASRYGSEGTVVVSPNSARYEADASRVIQSPNRGITTIGTFPGGQYRMRNVATYKEYCLRKGIEWNGDRFRRQLGRPVRFEFESNEEEERAIAEAIAKEEELMRLEEERKRSAMGISTETDLSRYEEEMRRKEMMTRREVEALRISSVPNRRLDENLTIKGNDSHNTVQIKQVLNELITQVCKWDKDYNWHKNLLRKAREQHEIDRSYRSHRSSKSRQKQLEIDLNERMDRIRKEVNKRRVRLENRVEIEMGMVVPWRRPRGRPNKAIKHQYIVASSRTLTNSNLNSETALNNATVKKEMVFENSKMEEVPTLIDPAAISLSDTFYSEESLGFMKREEKNHAIVDYSQASRISEELPNGIERSKEKSKERKKSNEGGKKTSAISHSLNNVQRGRGRPRKEADDSAKPSTSSSSPTSKAEKCSAGYKASEINKLCICNRPYDPKAFHVGCSSCYRWFHGKCMGISEKKWSKIKDWTCHSCTQPRVKNEVLYCVCQTPYDDSQFYVGCDRCEGWYHPQCVGITQAEAEAMEEYICPSCISGQKNLSDSFTSSGAPSFPTILTRKDYDLIGQLLATMKDQRASWPFRERADEKMYPQYYEKIKNPMDLSIVDNKIEQLKYHKLEEFLADIKLIFQNARTYHGKSSVVFRCADTVEKKFDTCFAKVKRQIELRHRERLRVSESKTVDSLDINTDELFPMGSDFDASVFDV